MNARRPLWVHLTAQRQQPRHPKLPLDLLDERRRCQQHLQMKSQQNPQIAQRLQQRAAAVFLKCLGERLKWQGQLGQPPQASCVVAFAKK